LPGGTPAISTADALVKATAEAAEGNTLSQANQLGGGAALLVCHDGEILLLARGSNGRSTGILLQRSDDSNLERIHEQFPRTGIFSNLVGFVKWEGNQ